MKRFILLVACIVFCLMKTQAQNDTTLTIAQVWSYPGDPRICANKYDRVILYAPEKCSDFGWSINGQVIYNESPIVFDKNIAVYYYCRFLGCGYDFIFGIHFIDPNVPTETTEEIWIHSGELAELRAVEDDSASMYNIRWNTGEDENVIHKPAGTYIAGISDMCATSYRTKVVKESVEITLATCDLETNLNMVTWQTTPAQAEYIDHVIVKRDGMQVGTAPYEDGQFIDNIGSGAASRTYTITAVATDGTQCPIVSYPKETIHMAYLTGINNTIEVNWNIPTGYDLLGYNICKYTPGSKDGDLTVIDFVGASVTSYTCSENLFDEGYIVVQGVEASKDNETRLLSNRSTDLVGIGEKEKQNFNIYPNPSAGRVTVEGTGRLTITNTLGQTLLTRDITDTETIELPRGVWFVKLNGTTRKLVVE